MITDSLNLTYILLDYFQDSNGNALGISANYRKGILLTGLNFAAIIMLKLTLGDLFS